MKKHVLSLILVLFTCPLYSYTLLDLAPDAVTASLNGGGDILVRNSYAIYNNPANLIFLFQGELTLNYMVFVDDIQRATVTWAWKGRSSPPFCLDLTYLSFGSIRQFTLGQDDYSVMEQAEIRPFFLEAGLSSSWKITFLGNNLLFGGKVSLLLNHLDQSYSGALFDAGLVYYPSFRGFAFSLVARNLGFIGSFYETAPLEVRLGAGYRYRNWETELNYNMGKEPMLKWGNSLEVLRHVKLLLGLKFDRHDILQNNLHMGLGFDLYPYSFHYTLVMKSILGNYHYFSVKREF